jgi:hypothetical protein
VPRHPALPLEPRCDLAGGSSRGQVWAMMPPLNAPIYAHTWSARQRQKFENIAKSETYVGRGPRGGLSGLYRYPSGQQPCAGRRPRSRDIERTCSLWLWRPERSNQSGGAPATHFTICPQAIEIEYPVRSKNRNCSRNGGLSRSGSALLVIVRHILEGIMVRIPTEPARSSSLKPAVNSD